MSDDYGCANNCPRAISCNGARTCTETGDCPPGCDWHVSAEEQATADRQEAEFDRQMAGFPPELRDYIEGKNRPFTEDDIPF